MARVLEDEVRITQNDPNVTVSAGVANALTKIAEFICPNRTAFKIRPGDILTVYASDVVPAEIADTSALKVRHTDPNGIVTRDLVTADYAAVKEWTDRNKLYTFGDSVTIRPQDRLQILINSSTVINAPLTRFQISCKRGAATII